MLAVATQLHAHRTVVTARLHTRGALVAARLHTRGSLVAARLHARGTLVAARLHVHRPRRFGRPSFDYGGLALAAAASWIGVPGPGEPAMIAAGVLAAEHRLPLLPVLLVGWAAATTGGIIGWLIGLRAGRALLTGPGPLRAMRVRTVARSERLFDSHPVVAVLLTPSWIAGIHRVRPTVYHAVNVTSAAVWAAGTGVGAYFVGPSVIDGVDDVGVATTIALVVVVAVVIGLELRRRRRRDRD